MQRRPAQRKLDQELWRDDTNRLHTIIGRLQTSRERWRPRGKGSANCQFAPVAGRVIEARGTPAGAVCGKALRARNANWQFALRRPAGFFSLARPLSELLYRFVSGLIKKGMGFRLQGCGRLVADVWQPEG